MDRKIQAMKCPKGIMREKNEEVISTPGRNYLKLITSIIVVIGAVQKHRIKKYGTVTSKNNGAEKNN